MSNGSLGALSIDILANIAGLVTDMAKANAESAKAAKEFQKQWQESIDNVTESFKGLAELAGVGLSLEWGVEIVKQAGEAAEQVDNLSKTLGITTAQLQAMSYGAGLVGGNLDTISSASARLERSMEMAAAGSKQQLEALRALGITAAQLPELIKNPGDAFEKLAQNVAHAGDGMGRTAAVMALFGRGGAQMIPFLVEFGGNLEEIKAKATALSVVLSDTDQGALAEMQKGLNEAGLAARGMGNEFALTLAPAVNLITGAFVSLAASAGVHEFFQSARDDVAQLIVVGKDITTTVAGWTSSFSEFGAELATIPGGFTALMNPLLALNAPFGQVVDWFHQITGASSATTTATKNDVAGWVEWVQDKTVIVVNDFANLWVLIEKGAYVAFTTAENYVIDFVKNATVELGHLADYTNVAKIFGGPTFENGAKSLVDGLKEVTINTQSFDDQLKINNAALDSSVTYNASAANATRATATTLEQATQATKDHGGALVDYTAKVSNASDGMKEFAKQELAMATKLDALSSDLEGPYAKAWATYSQQFDKVEEFLANAKAQYDAGHISLQEYNADVQIGHDLEAIYATQLDATNQKLNDQADIIGQLKTKLDDNTRLLSATGVAHKELQAIISAENDARKLYEQHLRDTATLTDDERAKVIALVDAHNQEDEAIKLSQEAMKQWASIASGAFDSAFQAINKDIIEGGSVMKDLVNVAKQVVEAILLQFEKLAIINPILNSLFGTSAGGGNLLPTLMNSLGGSGSGGGIANLIGGNGSGGGSLISSWLGGGSAAGTMTDVGGDALGGGAPVGFGSDYGGFFGGEGTTAGGAGSATSTATGGAGFSTLGALGGVMAGIGEYQAAGGGAGGIAGGVAYGIGTYFAASAVSAGLGAAAAGGLSAGLAAGFAAIPVVGWIAIAAMGLNMITGGGLFGTAGKPIGGNFTESYGPAGGTVTDEMTISGKKPLFGGRYFDETNIPDPKGQAAADSFFAALTKGQQAFADSLNDKLAQTVAGGSYTFKTDATGKEVAGSEVTKIGDQTFTGETEQQFQERLQSQAFLEVLDQMGLGASKFVAGVQGDADKLFAAVQDFAGATQAANANLAKGFQFMALGASETLPQIMQFVEGAAQAGETLSAAYNRLMQAQAAYNQFAAQFKPAPTYVDPFEQSLANLYTQMISAQHQANALAQAAGASGASVEDLTNIQKTYAAQAAQLTQQLEDSAQTLAFSLGLTTIGSLDQINQEISTLQGQSGTAATSVSNFGSAMTTVSQSATDAINLLLGNLSPLNDQQKLQAALQGLQAGTVTKDAVLTIGRRLYASSQAYNDLYAQVSQYGNGNASTGGTGGGYVGSGTVSGTTGTTDPTKLAALIAERDALQKAATMQQYQTLAQQIAEIASAKGEDWQAVLKEMGIKAADLETGLGLKDDAALAAYIKQFQAQTDSAKNNTQSIVDAILNLDKDLMRVLGDGSPVTGEPTITDPTQRISGPGPIDRINSGAAASPLNPRGGPGTVGSSTPVLVTLSPSDVNTLADNIGKKVNAGFKATVREHADTFMRSGR